MIAVINVLSVTGKMWLLLWCYLCCVCYAATPVGIIIPEIQETMDLLQEIIHTENIPVPVPEMTMAQCQGDTGSCMT